MALAGGVTVPSATHGVGSTPPWPDVCRQLLYRGFWQPVSQLWAQSRNLVTCMGSGTRWARRAAQGNLPHPEQTRTARPPPSALAAWHISLLSTACQKNSLAAWKRARLSRQHIHNTPPRKAVSQVYANKPWCSPCLPPATPMQRTVLGGCSCSYLGLEQPMVGQRILLPSPSPIPSPQPLLKQSVKVSALDSWVSRWIWGRIGPPDA